MEASAKVIRTKAWTLTSRETSLCEHKVLIIPLRSSDHKPYREFEFICLKRI